MIATEYSLQDQLNKKLLIIGDLIIDRTIYCTVPKISPEAPVPVAMVEPEGTIETPGGAGLAASYAVKNNIESIFLTTVGEDRIDFLLNNYIWSEQLVYNTILNPRKTRYIDIESNHHLLRADTDKIIDKSIFKKNSHQHLFLFRFLSTLEKENIAGIMMLDYCKGIFENEELVKAMIGLAKVKGIPIYVDSRSDDLMKFKGADVIKLNTKEFEVASNALNISCPWQLKKHLGVDNLVVTHGKDGAILYKDGVVSSKVVCQPDLSSFNGAPDVTGCGDVFDVTFCFSWCIKEVDISNALHIAVDKATEFAYKSIKERLYVNTERKDTKY